MPESAHDGLPAALQLGRQAVALGLETLELARIHGRALATLELGKGRKILLRRAENFFNEAIIPIVETQRVARRGKTDLQRVNATLERRTAELAESNGRHYRKCLEESLELQKRLRQLTHRVLAAQEEERHKISHELQDEIAQTLLGINVRLISLKRASRHNQSGFKNEIASAQRLVVKSAKSICRFARELNHNPPA